MQYVYFDRGVFEVGGEKTYIYFYKKRSSEECERLEIELVGTRHFPNEERHIQKRMKIDPLSHVSEQVWQYAKTRGIV